MFARAPRGEMGRIQESESDFFALKEKLLSDIDYSMELLPLHEKQNLLRVREQIRLMNVHNEAPTFTNVFVTLNKLAGSPEFHRIRSEILLDINEYRQKNNTEKPPVLPLDVQIFSALKTYHEGIKRRRGRLSLAEKNAVQDMDLLINALDPQNQQEILSRLASFRTDITGSVEFENLKKKVGEIIDASKNISKKIERTRPQLRANEVTLDAITKNLKGPAEIRVHALRDTKKPHARTDTKRITEKLKALSRPGKEEPLTFTGNLNTPVQAPVERTPTTAYSPLTEALPSEIFEPEPEPSLEFTGDINTPSPEPTTITPTRTLKPESAFLSSQESVESWQDDGWGDVLDEEEPKKQDTPRDLFGSSENLPIHRTGSFEKEGESFSLPDGSEAVFKGDKNGEGTLHITKNGKTDRKVTGEFIDGKLNTEKPATVMYMKGENIIKSFGPVDENMYPQGECHLIVYAPRKHHGFRFEGQMNHGQPVEGTLKILGTTTTYHGTFDEHFTPQEREAARPLPNAAEITPIPDDEDTEIPESKPAVETEYLKVIESLKKLISETRNYLLGFHTGENYKEEGRFLDHLDALLNQENEHGEGEEYGKPESMLKACGEYIMELETYVSLVGSETFDAEFKKLLTLFRKNIEKFFGGRPLEMFITPDKTAPPSEFPPQKIELEPEVETSPSQNAAPLDPLEEVHTLAEGAVSLADIQKNTRDLTATETELQRFEHSDPMASELYSLIDRVREDLHRYHEAVNYPNELIVVKNFESIVIKRAEYGGVRQMLEALEEYILQTEEYIIVHDSRTFDSRFIQYLEETRGAVENHLGRPLREATRLVTTSPAPEPAEEPSLPYFKPQIPEPEKEYEIKRVPEPEYDYGGLRNPMLRRIAEAREKILSNPNPNKETELDILEEVEGAVRVDIHGRSFINNISSYLLEMQDYLQKNPSLPFTPEFTEFLNTLTDFCLEKQEALKDPFNKEAAYIVEQSHIHDQNLKEGTAHLTKREKALMTEVETLIFDDHSLEERLRLIRRVLASYPQYVQRTVSFIIFFEDINKLLASTEEEIRQKAQELPDPNEEDEDENKDEISDFTEIFAENVQRFITQNKMMPAEKKSLQHFLRIIEQTPNSRERLDKINDWIQILEADDQGKSESFLNTLYGLHYIINNTYRDLGLSPIERPGRTPGDSGDAEIDPYDSEPPLDPEELQKLGEKIRKEEATFSEIIEYYTAQRSITNGYEKRTLRSFGEIAERENNDRELVPLIAGFNRMVRGEIASRIEKDKNYVPSKGFTEFLQAIVDHLNSFKPTAEAPSVKTVDVKQIEDQREALQKREKEILLGKAYKLIRQYVTDPQILAPIVNSPHIRERFMESEPESSLILRTRKVVEAERKQRKTEMEKQYLLIMEDPEPEKVPLLFGRKAALERNAHKEQLNQKAAADSNFRYWQALEKTMNALNAAR